MDGANAQSARAERPVSPMMLLLRVSALQIWRKFAAIRHQSRLLSLFVGLFMAGYAYISFALFYRGLRFIGSFPGLGDVLIERLLFLMFAILFVMLLFSNLIIGYTNLFRNRETTFLMTSPVSFQTIFCWKFIETAILASWAFLFLVAPLLAAYGLNNDAPWHFYVVTAALMLIFIVLPTSLGAFCAVSVARFMDRRSFQVAIIGLAGVLLVGAALYMKPEIMADDFEENRVLGLMDRLLVRTRFAHYPLLPSYWLSSGVMHWLEGGIATAAFFLLVMLSYALFFGFLSFTSMGRMFYSASSSALSRGGVFGQWDWIRKRGAQKAELSESKGLSEIVLGWCFWLRADVRTLLVKDIRVFWRDTTQWGQTLILFGLLGVYILNLRHFSSQMVNPFWIVLVSYLNLFTCSLNLATLTTRFVYPQFSLEGKRIWIIGMAPLGMARVIRTKFWLAALAALTVTLGLMWLSCRMLQLSTDRTIFFSGVITVMTFTLTGLAVGLGALCPNFKEDNPSKIVSGFGGTLCLVLSFVYIVFSVATLAMGSTGWRLRGSTGIPGVGAAVLFITVSALLLWLPMKFGLRKAVNTEL
jgi:ABC-2 type transport system permease protein